MTTPDPAKTVKDAIAAVWAEDHPSWTATLEVADDYQPTAGSPVLLVADDGVPFAFGGAWLVRKGPLRITLRLTAFARGRTEAREVVDAGTDFVLAQKPGIARVENVSGVLETRDRDTGAYLASITVPVTVRYN